MYVWARKRENDMLMSAYCMNKELEMCVCMCEMPTFLP